jgi:hypothetical protein
LLIAVVDAGSADLPRGFRRTQPLTCPAWIHLALLTTAPGDLTMVPKARGATLAFSPAHFYGN